MNRLQYETSPYLLQHAGNPVDWYAWKEEAFERARLEDKPILVSIGYSTCHWCHVMERESFEDASIAAFMNHHFINIKVDREERPDVDQIYMEACQAISGQGGWPLNCFLLPDGRPFFAGTYYPPRPAHNRPSWRQLLERLSSVYRQDRTKVEQQADQLTAIISRSDSIFLKDVLAAGITPEDHFKKEVQDRILEKLGNRFDSVSGGFGSAPKFPEVASLNYLLEYDHYYGSPEARDHVFLTLDKMIRGGIYDQLGGGFARYSTDRAWLAPHFEKMLYDNALLVQVLADAFRITGNSLYRETIEETLGFIEREMTSAEGGFFAALDADSEGEEGKYYVWDKSEIDRALGSDAETFCDFYDISPDGNWEGKNILRRNLSLKKFAAARNLEAAKLKEELASGRSRLLQIRGKRVRPGLDDKILLGWNALQCTAYARAFAALGNESYRNAALRNVDFLLSRFRDPSEKGFFHTYKDGKTQYPAFLDDLAFLIEALIEVYQICFDERYLNEARRIADFVIRHFHDRESGLFFYTSGQQKDVILRKKELYDSSTPSGNSTMAGNLLRLAVFFDQSAYRSLAAGMLLQMIDAVEKYPSSFARWASVGMRLSAPAYEIAVIGTGSDKLAAGVNAKYIPNKILMAAEEPTDAFPLLAGKKGGHPPLIYICEQYACRRPVATLAEMEKIVSR